jgi:signal transduction histidine kinase
VRSPLEGASWRATLSILLGLGIAIAAIGLLERVLLDRGLAPDLAGRDPDHRPRPGLSRVVARVERWRMGLTDPRPLVAHPYRPLDFPIRAPYGAWIRAWAEAEFLDANRWRDVVYVLVLLPLALVEFVISIGLWVSAAVLLSTPLILAALRAARIEGFVEVDMADWAGGTAAAVLVGAILVPVAASVSRGLVALHRAVVAGLLCVDPTEALRQDVERLRGSRTAALELEASELRRIERDLHDGAQQRLVMLTIDLGLASERIDSDPEAAAKAIIVEARAEARQALAELR